jgi:hypothetical protein
MTPKEKAEELIEDSKNKFRDILQKHEQYHYCLDDISKECALTVVDELLTHITNKTVIYDLDKELNYWEEVKQEIEIEKL